MESDATTWKLRCKCGMCVFCIMYLDQSVFLTVGIVFGTVNLHYVGNNSVRLFEIPNYKDFSCNFFFAKRYLGCKKFIPKEPCR